VAPLDDAFVDKAAYAYPLFFHLMLDQNGVFLLQLSA
jgi:hypothetical protein